MNTRRLVSLSFVVETRCEGFNALYSECASMFGSCTIEGTMQLLFASLGRNASQFVVRTAQVFAM